LALAHTPKRDLSKPITRNDLSGSKALMNFCDSSFSIGESHNDKNLRYIKQIKERFTEKIYDAENVAVCQIEKPYNFLQFDLIGFSTEKEHLKEITEKDKGQKVSEVLEFKKQGMTNIEIARRLGVSEGAVRKWIKKANEVEPK
jgi:predicted transcriptional regulator